MTLADRLKNRRHELGYSQAQVAKMAGLSQPSYGDLEKGVTKSSRRIVQIATALKVSPQWLTTGEGEMQTSQQIVDDLISSMPNGITYDQVEPWRKQIYSEVYDARFCCGDGAGYPEFEPLKKTLPFDESFFSRRGIKPENFKIIYAKGDSMSPYINEGDAVGIDVSVIEPKEGEVYALFWDGDLLIKRIYKEGGGVLRLTSDNKSYPDKIVNDSNGESLCLIGRVMYRSG